MKERNKTIGRIREFLRQSYEGSERDLIIFVFFATSVFFTASSYIAMNFIQGPMQMIIMLALFGSYLLAIILTLLNSYSDNTLMITLKKYGIMKKYEPFDFQRIMDEAE
jgi:hypothetical protein